MASEDKVFGFDAAEDSTGFLLWQVTNTWQREIRKALEPFAITHSQFVLLASVSWLTGLGSPVTEVLLSDHSKIDPMTTSTVLRTLQKKGLVLRQEHETDTRAKTVALTAAGESLVKQAVATVERFDHDFFSRLGAEINGFNRQLSSLL